MIPYTYHLYHIPTDRHYYGVRYKKDCSPDDLWKTYFSSSDIVHELIEQYGKESFKVKVRKIFTTAEEAIMWESKFLQRINAHRNEKWLNRSNGNSNFMGPKFHSKKSRKKMSAKIKGIKKSEETKIKLSIAAKKREMQRRMEGWRMPRESIERSVKTRQEKIKQGIINPYSQERNMKMAQSKRGKKRKYLPDGSFIMVDPQQLQ